MTHKKVTRYLAVVLAGLICLMLCSCERSPQAAKTGETPTLRIYMKLSAGGLTEEDVKPLLEEINGYGTDFKVEFTASAFATDSEQELLQEKEKIEMMSGGGADVYLCACTDGASYMDVQEGTFAYPKSTMEKGYFLPLDDYLTNASYMEVESFQPQVLAAGRTDNGQVAIPMTFALTTTLASSDVTVKDEQMETLDEQLQSEELWQRIAARSTPFAFAERFGEYVDYETDSLRITEEELLQRVEEFFAIPMGDAEFDEMNRAESWAMAETISPESTRLTQPSQQKQLDYTFLPTYSVEGGVTATVTSFAAVNAETEYPEYAFAILDRLLARDVQELCKFADGMPIDTTLGSSGKKISTNGWSLSKHNFEQYQALCEKITAVKFRTKLDYILEEMLQNCDENNIEQRKQAVSDAYAELLMMVNEL